MAKWRENIEAFLELRKMTARQLSLGVGKSRGYISSIISGQHDPSLETFAKIAELLDVPIGQLYSGEVEPKSRERILDLIADMSEKEQEKAADVLKAIKT